MRNGRIAALALAIAVAIGSDVCATEREHRLRQELAELKQLVTNLVKRVSRLEDQIQSIEEAIAGRKGGLLFPLDTEKGMLRDAEERSQQLLERPLDSPLEIRPLPRGR
jgi:uncharacterized protein (DUF342 family)